MKTLDVVSLMQYIVVSPHASGVIVPPGHMYMCGPTCHPIRKFTSIDIWFISEATYLIPTYHHWSIESPPQLHMLTHVSSYVCVNIYIYVCECSTQSQLWFIIHFVVLKLIIQMFCKSSLTVSCHHIWVSGSGVTITASRRYFQRQSPARACGDMDLSSV